MQDYTPDIKETVRVIHQLRKGSIPADIDIARLNGHGSIVVTLIEARKKDATAFWTRLGGVLNADPILDEALFNLGNASARTAGADAAPPWKFYWEDELDQLPKPKTLIDHHGMVVADNASTILLGKPGVGKSLFAISLALATAQQVNPRDEYVLYIAAEKEELMQFRIDAWYKHWGVKPLRNFRLAAGKFNMLDTDQVTQLIDQMLIDGRKPRLVILDTFNRAFPDDENSAKAMNQFNDSAERIRQAYQCAFVILHHPPKGRDNSPRGHSSFSGAVHSTYVLKEPSPGVLVLENEKRNSGAKTKQARFRKQSVDVGIDSVTGESIGAVIVPMKSGETTESEVRTPPAELKILRVLAAAKEGLRQTDIAAQGGIGDSAVSKAIGPLAAKGYAKQIGKEWYITPEGQSFLAFFQAQNKQELPGNR